ncbi:MarR family winged helix-turn-helix transcriptional regulator [Paenibacillus caui]|uniref:MarR family winged helix-turn-helix transcriptional regulator n=1 Tax=Paenibacillus caui TaxID=2873927 RepID=UPI001CA9DEC5|nr:MarR family transcriptional regulator [Paenibacillus caui]
MEVNDPAVNRLLEILRQFRRSEPHKPTFEGCNPSMIRVLFIIRRGGAEQGEGLTISEISNLMEVTPPTVTQLIKNLEAEGLVERINDRKDRRVVRVLLTEQGKNLVQRAQANFVQRLKGLTNYLGEEQTEQLTTLLEKALKYLNQNKNESEV